jgi:hypothetical protein
VSVEAEARMGEARKLRSALNLPDQTNSPAPTALVADFFDGIDPFSPSAPLSGCDAILSVSAKGAPRLGRLPFILNGLCR